MNYVDAINKVLVAEGGFVNDPSDSGGATNFGITQGTYETFKGRKVSLAEMKAMPKSDAIKIYKTSYWNKIGGDQLKSFNVAYALFDQAVNRGPGAAIKLAQKIVGVKADGGIGPATIAALNNFDEKKFLERFLAETIAAYQALVINRPKDAKFLNGWLNRVAAISDFVGVKPSQALGGIAMLLVCLLILIQLTSKSKLA